VKREQPDFKKMILRRGTGGRPAAKEEGKHENMKKFLGKIIMKLMFPNRYVIKTIKKQGKNNNRIKLS
jgi:hypothetical protein